MSGFLPSKVTFDRSANAPPSNVERGAIHPVLETRESKIKAAVAAQAIFGAHGRARRKQREHWRPLRLRIIDPNTRSINQMLDYQMRVGDSIRELKTSDTHIRIPPNIGQWLQKNVAMDPDGDPAPQLLYAAKISQRFKDRIITETPCGVGFACPFPLGLFQYIFSYYRLYSGCVMPQALKLCDQPMLYHAKQYDRRTYLYLYDNRIEANYPTIRFPWGFLGCGSWNEDNVRVHHFDRGSFGFRQVPCGSPYHCCFIWEPFGEVVGRQRCPCNGPLYSHGKLNCNQWCCDHWCMTLCCCHYQYPGLDDAAEFAVAADVALQAYFDNERLTKPIFDARLDAELLKRGLPKRRTYAQQDHEDRWAYSRTKSLIAVTIGISTVVMQVLAITAGALYLRYYLQRDEYISYAASLQAQAVTAIQPGN